MYGRIVTAVDVFNLEIEQRERLLQREWRFRHLESLETRIARAVLNRVIEFIRNALPPKQPRANSVSESLSP
jgi:hypothetical protein